MAVVYVNKKPVDIGNEKLNAIQAAMKGGVFIPHYCWHPALTVVASCRMCLVEIGERKPDGTESMQPKVVPGCQTPVKDGTLIVTNSPKVKDAQGQTLEGLLLNHPLDCPVCDKAGECLLQDFSYNFGRAQSRMIDEKNTPPNKPHIGDNVTLFTDRCILCSRCVRFTREITGTAELQVINRGDHSEIDIFPGEPLNNKLASNVVDLCPVGALCSKDFLYKHRVWNLKTQKSVCADCSTGCSIFLDGNKNIVYRLRPRENPKAQGFFMCDDGRLGYHYVNSIERFTRPMARLAGKLTPQPWTAIVSAIRRSFKDAAVKNAGAVAAVLSPFLTCEEAYLLARFFKGLSKQVRLVLGPVPVVGEDDTYPKDRKGKPIQPVKFTIRAEKCPNRRGVEAVLKHFQGNVVGFDEIVKDAGEGKVQALYLAAGYPPRPGGWVNAEQANALEKVPVVVCHDLLPSPVSNFAHYVLPGAAFAEKDGTFVNHAGLAQALHWGVTPTGECRTDGQVFLDLLERRGLVHIPALRKELAGEIPYFAPLSGDDLGEYGIPLEAAPAAVKQAARAVREDEALMSLEYDINHFWVTVILIAVVMGAIQGTCAYLILAERKISAWAQDRIGPNRVGPFGLLQPIADGAKFLLKEEVIPGHVDKLFYLLAPAVAITTALLAFTVVPFGPTSTPPVMLNRLADDLPAGEGLTDAQRREVVDFVVQKLNLPTNYAVPETLKKGVGTPLWQQTAAERELVLKADAVYAEAHSVQRYEDRLKEYNDSIQFVIAPRLDIGIVFVFAVGSLAVYAIVLGGWSSNNKYSFLGSLRSSAQLISYEIPLGMSVLGVMLLTGSLNMEHMIADQSRHGWNFLYQPLACVLFMTSVFAECNRLPFDLPEAEQELVGGYHTEYSAMKFALFFLAEYTHMITTSFLVVTLFFGGWNLPWVTTPETFGNLDVVLKVVVIGAKMLAFIVFYMLIRWTLPRFRFDQLMSLAWKVMMPLALVNLVFVMVVVQFGLSRWWLLPLSLALLVGAGYVALLMPKRRERKKVYFRGHELVPKVMS